MRVCELSPKPKRSVFLGFFLVSRQGNAHARDHGRNLEIAASSLSVAAHSSCSLSLSLEHLHTRQSPPHRRFCQPAFAFSPASANADTAKRLTDPLRHPRDRQQDGVGRSAHARHPRGPSRSSSAAPPARRLLRQRRQLQETVRAFCVCRSPWGLIRRLPRAFLGRQGGPCLVEGACTAARPQTHPFDQQTTSGSPACR